MAEVTWKVQVVVQVPPEQRGAAKGIKQALADAFREPVAEESYGQFIFYRIDLQLSDLKQRLELISYSAKTVVDNAIGRWLAKSVN